MSPLTLFTYFMHLAHYENPAHDTTFSFRVGRPAAIQDTERHFVF